MISFLRIDKENVKIFHLLYSVNLNYNLLNFVALSLLFVNYTQVTYVHILTANRWMNVYRRLGTQILVFLLSTYNSLVGM